MDHHCRACVGADALRLATACHHRPPSPPCWPVAFTTAPAADASRAALLALAQARVRMHSGQCRGPSACLWLAHKLARARVHTRTRHTHASTHTFVRTPKASVRTRTPYALRNACTTQVVKQHCCACWVACRLPLSLLLHATCVVGQHAHKHTTHMHMHTYTRECTHTHAMCAHLGSIYL